MEVKRQDFRAEIGRDAEAAEHAFIREDLQSRQSLEAGERRGTAAVFRGERVAQGLVGRERWQVMIHIPAALDDRAAEQIPASQAPDGVRGGKLRGDAETAG